jgi:phosphoglycerol transferase MdoB-like AlkP superfamily enzyme
MNVRPKGDGPALSGRGGFRLSRAGHILLDVDSNTTRVQSRLRAGGPLTFLAVMLLAGLALLATSRLLLTGLYRARLGSAPQDGNLFWIGFQLDVITLCGLLFLPALLLFFLPGRQLRRRAVIASCTLGAGVIAYFELAAVPFLREYGSRPNRVFFEYLAYPREVVLTVFRNCPVEMLVGHALVVALAVLAWRHSRWLLRQLDDWPWGLRLAWLPVVMVVLAAGARVTPLQVPAGIGLAAFSGSHLANELALNSTYSLLYAIYSHPFEDDAARFYGQMPWNEVIARVRRGSRLNARAFSDPAIPTLHRQVAAHRATRTPNLVIFVQESLGARYVASLGGRPLTPNLDRLSRQGLYFTQLYATGNRTVRGLEALVCGFPPTPAPSVLRLDRAQRNFFTVAQLLRGRGYATEFIYGGVADFDNMSGFFLGNGFDRVIDQDDFSQPVFTGTWGASDEDLALKANEVFRAHGNRPFFALMLSTSNHEPFDFPAGRVPPARHPLRTRDNAVQYADYAIGRFFDMARREAYYRDTIFLIVADHDAQAQDSSHLLPLENFRIPALILGPGVPQRRIERIASQIDLLPTLLALMGIDTEHPMIGRDLLAVTTADPGRALMQFGLINAYRAGDRLVTLQPGGIARHFQVDGESLVETAADAELARDALAHVLWASHSYQAGLYRLPERTALLAAAGAGTTSPAAASRRRSAMSGKPTSAVGSSLRRDSHRLMPSPSD